MKNCGKRTLPRSIRSFASERWYWDTLPVLLSCGADVRVWTLWGWCGLKLESVWGLKAKSLSAGVLGIAVKRGTGSNSTPFFVPWVSWKHDLRKFLRVGEPNTQALSFLNRSHSLCLAQGQATVPCQVGNTGELLGRRKGRCHCSWSLLFPAPSSRHTNLSSSPRRQKRARISRSFFSW